MSFARPWALGFGRFCVVFVFIVCFLFVFTRNRQVSIESVHLPRLPWLAPTRPLRDRGRGAFGLFGQLENQCHGARMVRFGPVFHTFGNLRNSEKQCLGARTVGPTGVHRNPPEFTGIRIGQNVPKWAQ